MQNNIIYNQRFNKSVNDIESIITEFRKLINQDKTNSDDLVRIQLLKNELKTATNSLIDEVENTDRSKITIFTELTKDDIEALKRITINTEAVRTTGIMNIKLDVEVSDRYLLQQFIDLIEELKEYSE